MFEAFQDGGHIMWVMLCVAVVMIGLAVNAARRLYAREPGSARAAAAEVDAVLFWGLFAGVMGLLGTTVGLSMAARAIERAGSVDAALTWGGIRVALIPTIFGLCILGLALLTWLPLRAKARRLGRVAAG